MGDFLDGRDKGKDALVLLIGALAHDVDHPGHSNSLEARASVHSQHNLFLAQHQYALISTFLL